MITMPQGKYKALLFDLNGTMIDDMSYHITAWHRILNELGAGITIEKAKQECYGKNDELLERVFPGRFTDGEKNKLSFAKEREYQQAFKPRLKLIDGLNSFLKKTREAGMKMAIGSAAIRYNVDFVLEGLQLHSYFDTIVSADNVTRSKPDPETWLRCAAALELKPEECLVVEDAPKGVESAANAGMSALVITTMHTPADFAQYKNIIGFIRDYKDTFINELQQQLTHA